MSIAVAPDPTDVCAFGHQLAPGSDPIELKVYDEDGRLVSEETKLLRHHACMGPGGLYQGGHRETELDDRGRLVREWVEGADPHDHGMGTTDVTRLIPYPCEHGLPVSELPADEPGRKLAKSCGRGHWITYDHIFQDQLMIIRMRCPVCLGGEAPDWRA